MASMGLSPKQYNDFFLKYSYPVCMRLAAEVGDPEAVSLTNEIFKEAQAVMVQIPSEGLGEELCAKILAGAEKRVLSRRNGDRPDKELPLDPVAKAEPTLTYTVEPERQVKPAAAQPEAEYYQTSLPGLEQVLARPEPPLGWVKRGGFDAAEPMAPVEAEPVEIAKAPPEELYHPEPIAEPEPEKAPENLNKRTGGKKALVVMGLVLMILVVIFLLWVLVGVMMSAGVIPVYNMGFEWFDAHVFNLF